MFSKFPRQFENLAGVAALEFQFDFADGSGSAPRTDFPFIECDFDSASVPAHRSDGAANSRLENRHELVLELLGQQRSQRGALNFAEVGNIAFDLAFPFPAPKGTVGALRFYGRRRFLPLRRMRSEIPFLPSLCFGVSK